VYYRFPSNLKTHGLLPLHPVKVSAGISRDAEKADAIKDTAETAIGFNAGPFGFSLQGSISGLAEPEAAPLPFPVPSSWEFSSAKISGTVSYSRGALSFGGKAGYTAAKAKDPVWDGSVSAAIRGKPGRFSVKISSPDFPEQWDCTLSWRLGLADIKLFPDN
jgi:hypothetical protein